MPSDFPILLAQPAPRLRVAFPARTVLLVTLFLPVLGLCVIFDLIYYLIVRMR